MNKKNSENGNEKNIQELLSSNKPLLLEVRAEYCDHSIFIIQELLSSNKPLLLEVRAEYCDHSIFIETIIRKIENEFDNRIRIARIDYQTYKKLLPGIDVENFPTVLLIKDKKVSKEINGTISRTNLKVLANEVLKNNQVDEEEEIS